MPTRVYIPTEPYTPTGESMYAQPAPDNALLAAPEQQSALSRGINRLLGTQFGEERYQTWPEKMIRSAATLAGDVVSGAVPVLPPGSRREDFTDEPAPGVDSNAPWWKVSRWVPPVAAQPNDVMMERAQDLAGVAMGGGIGGTGKAAAAGEAVLGSGPVRQVMRNSDMPVATAREQQLLRKAVREEEFKPFDQYPRQEVPIKELLATQEEVAPAIVQKKLQEEAHKGDNDVFIVKHDGKYYVEDGHHTITAAAQAGQPTIKAYVQEIGGSTPVAEAAGGKTLRSGMGDEGAGPVPINQNAPAWYSAVEHALEQSTTGAAPGAQWLATLRNSRGVKPEEMGWLGLDDYLAQAQVEGRKVTRAELQDYVRSHQVELRDVEKGVTRSYETMTPEEQAAARQRLQEFLGLDEQQFRREYPTPRDVSDGVNAMLRYFGDKKTGSSNTKYHDYQLPGGENYREHLITLPEKSKALSKEQLDETAQAWFGKNYDELKPNEQAETKINLAGHDREPTYHSSHWDEPNILAHVRTNDRVMQVPFTAEETAAIKAHEAASTKLEALRKQQGEVGKEIAAAAKPLEAARRAEILAENKAGRLSNAETMRKLEEPAEHPQLAPLQEKLAAIRAQESKLRSSLPEKPEPRQVKSLHLEEVQSDWHQQGRDKGYSTGKVYMIRNRAGDVLERLPSEAEARAYIDQRPGEGLDFSTMKPVGGVPDAPFKKTWHELALKRMLRRAAEEGYERLSWTPGEAQAARYDLSKQVDNLKVWPEGGGKYYFEAKKGSRDLGLDKGKSYTPEELEGIIGKEITKKAITDIEAGNPVNYSGLDLKIGGEGMRGFYDQILPKALEKIGREHGVKVQRGEVKIGERPDYSAPIDYNRTKSAVVADTAPIFYIDIPQSLRDAAMRKGFPLFSGGKMFVPHQEEDK